MNQKENQPIPDIGELGSELTKTTEWLHQWQNQFREKYGLTNDVLDTIGVLGGSMENTAQNTTFKINVDHGLESNFGVVSVLCMEAVTENPDLPLVIRFFYRPRDFENMVAISSGWRFSESEILYEIVSLPDGKLVKLAKIAHPGVLFPVPDILSNEKGMAQRLELDFNYAEDDLTEWTAEIGFENQNFGAVLYKNGVATEARGEVVEFDSITGGFYKYGQQDIYNLPRTIDPTPHLQAVTKGKLTQ